eukprot:1686518-Prymnesium_polylepis.1
MPKLGVGRGLLTSCHRAACSLANVKFEKVTKAQFLKMGLGEDVVIRPEGSLGSHIEYLKSLSDSDLIEISSRAASHKLSGKVSNNAM